jgi:hypothetical protein
LAEELRWPGWALRKPFDAFFSKCIRGPPQLGGPQLYYRISNFRKGFLRTIVAA